MKTKNLTISYTVGMFVLVFILGFGELANTLRTISQLSVHTLCRILWSLAPLWLAVVLLQRGRGNTAAQYSDKTIGTVMKLLALAAYFMTAMTVWSALTYEVPDTNSFQAEAHLWNEFGRRMFTALTQFAQGSMMFAAGKWVARAQMPPKKYTAWFVILLVAIFAYWALSGMVSSFRISQLGVYLMLYATWCVPKVLRQEPAADEEGKQPTVGKGRIVLAIIVILLALLMGALENSAPSYGSKEYHDKVFDKNPNEWTEQEERYVNDLFEFVDENN